MHTILIRDDSIFSKDFARHLKSTLISDPSITSARPLENTELEIRPEDNNSKIFEAVGNIPKVQANIVLLMCDKKTALRVFAQASKANILREDRIWILIEDAFDVKDVAALPAGIIGIKMRQQPLDKPTINSAVEVFSEAVQDLSYSTWGNHYRNYTTDMSCWFGPGDIRKDFSSYVHRSIQQTILEYSSWRKQRRRQHTRKQPQKQNILLPVIFDIYNLLPSPTKYIPRKKRDLTPNVRIFKDPLLKNLKHQSSTIRSNNQSLKTFWRQIGNVESDAVTMDTVLWLMANRIGPPSIGRQRFRVVTTFAPPFVMPATRMDNGSCLLGVPCLQVNTSSKKNLSRIFADYSSSRRDEGRTYNISCCSGISIDMMLAMSKDLAFDVDLYLVADGFFGTKKKDKWNGITADIISGAAHMVFSAYSLTRLRTEVLDFSVPFYHSGVSCLTYTEERDVPLSAFLVPFSFQLWIAIFASLNATAVFAAIYEWLSPFGLNPWGRMRSKNFSLASALWVMWSLLFSHLVAFKAPKSWPNKVLINLWGCFSVIFVSSYTANIAAHFAGLFFHLRVDDFHDASLLNQRTGTTKSSAAESYIFAKNPELHQHIQNYGVATMGEGLEKLRKGELDVLIGDTSVLDYFRGNEPGCGLHLLGQSIFYDAYAVGMQKGFPLKDAISTLILRYESYGFIEQLQKKWFGRVPCFSHSVNYLNKPKPLSIGAVAGVFVMLVVGLGAGIVILVIEHLVFKHALPVLRKKPSECFWKSPNLMFFSQKLYRFINTVELVSPHHSAKEIVSNLREGQIFSLFQKSVKRKAKEEARRRRSKSQFFEMIQEIRKIVRIQKEQRRTLPGGDLDPNQQFFELPEQVQEHTTFIEHDENRHLLQTQVSFATARTVPQSEQQPARTMRKSILKLGSKSRQYNQLPVTLEHSPSPMEKDIRRKKTKRKAITASPESDSSSDPLNAYDLKSDLISISVDDLRLADDGKSSPLDRTSRKLAGFLSMDDIRLWKQRKKTKFNKALERSGKCTPDSRTASYNRIIAAASTEFDEHVLYSLSKEDILYFWRHSERRLLNTLRDALKEKKTLEEKLSILQRTLINKPTC